MIFTFGKQRLNGITIWVIFVYAIALARAELQDVCLCRFVSSAKLQLRSARVHWSSGEWVVLKIHFPVPNTFVQARNKNVFNTSHVACFIPIYYLPVLIEIYDLQNFASTSCSSPKTNKHHVILVSPRPEPYLVDCDRSFVTHARCHLNASRNYLLVSKTQFQDFPTADQWASSRSSSHVCAQSHVSPSGVNLLHL